MAKTHDIKLPSLDCITDLFNGVEVLQPEKLEGLWIEPVMTRQLKLAVKRPPTGPMAEWIVVIRGPYPSWDRSYVLGPFLNDIKHQEEGQTNLIPWTNDPNHKAKTWS